MDDFITGNLRALYPGGIPETAIAAPGADAERVATVEITDPAPSHIRIVHRFGEDPLDFVRLGALIAGAWLLWKWYAQHNNRG